MPEFTSVYSVISASWGLKFCLILLGAAATGWNWSRQFTPRAHPDPIWAVLIGLHAIPLALFLPLAFSWRAVALAAAMLAVSGRIFRPTISAQGSTPDESSAEKFAIPICIILVTFWVYLTLRPFPFTHYDYYLNSNLLSLDFARSGSAASAWAVKHDIHNWVLIQLTSTVALDAFEMQWLSTNTNVLPRLLELCALCCTLTLVIRRSRIGALLLAAVFLLYLFEQSIQFRPHLFVGTFLAIAALLLAAIPYRATPVVLIALMLALAKRDGLVLAPIVAMLSYRKFSLKIHGTVALICLLIAASFLQIGGRSPLFHLYQTVFRPQNLAAFFEFTASPLFLSFLAAFSYLAWNHRYDLALRKALLLIASALAMTLAGSLILVDAGYLTPGTNMRKVLYILAPSTAALFCAHGWPRNKFSLRSSKALICATALFGIMVHFAAQPLLEARNILPNWTNAAIGGTRYLRSLIPDLSNRPRIGIYSPNEDSITLSPFGDLQTFRWLFLIAYIGQKIEIESNIEKLDESDFIFLPPELNDQERIELASLTNRFYYKLYGVYGILAKPEASEMLALEHTKALPGGHPNTVPTTSLRIEYLNATWGGEVHKFDVSLLDYPGERTLQQIYWDPAENANTSTITLGVQNPMQQMIRYIEFSEPPWGKSGIEHIIIETPEGTHEFNPSTIERNGIYSIPVNSRGPLKIRMTARDAPPQTGKWIRIFNAQAEVENVAAAN